MNLPKKILALLLAATMASTLGACSGKEKETGATTVSNVASTEAPTGTDAEKLSKLSTYQQDSKKLTFDNSSWNYDADNNVYYQIGVAYCATPETKDYETMGIYVPGAYLTGKKNSSGTYTCTVSESGSVGNYTAKTAPIVFPVNTPGYASQAAPTSYSYDGLSDYLKAGMIYVYAGMRGRDNGYDSNNKLTYSGGAPWGLTDLKAAIRYYRFNSASLPGSTDSMFTFGMSGGGAQSALAGASGDSTLYFSYLTSIGAAMLDAKGNYISDAVSGSMCWCPITSLDYADEAYEWNMGQYATTGTRADGTWTALLSKDLAASFADYINKLGLKDENGVALSLEKSSSGVYASGSYYDYLLSVAETSLNHFLSDTTFPYTPSNAFNASGNFGGGKTDSNAQSAASAIAAQGGTSSGTTGSMPSGSMPTGSLPSGSMPSGSMPAGGPTQSSQDTKTYATVQEYIDSLNSDGKWITYDASSNTATITSLKDFVTHCKTASKDVCAFDSLNLSAGENSLFGNDQSNTAHFDSVLSALLSNNKDKYAAASGWDASLISTYSNSLAATDKEGNTVQTRLNMYNPMYYLSSYYDGHGTSTVAPHWRIRTGIEQGDTALTVETNLALALQQYEGVKDVDFETVWGMKHTMAERTGDSTANFIEWVSDCVS